MRGKSEWQLETALPFPRVGRLRPGRGWDLAQGLPAARSRSQKLGLGVSWHAGVSHGHVLSDQYHILCVVGEKVKEGRLDLFS